MPHKPQRTPKQAGSTGGGVLVSGGVVADGIYPDCEIDHNSEVHPDCEINHI